MSEQYGLISSTDAATLKKVIDLICDDFDCETINSVEVGLYSGLTSKYIVDCIKSNGKYNVHTGIDNLKDGEDIIHFPVGGNLIIGNSTEVYHQLQNNSQHFAFVDGDHSLIGVISDFFAYGPKVKMGGYLCFHDAGPHIKPFKDFQHGDPSNPYAYISVRRALGEIGIFKNRFPEWRIVFDEADPNDEAGGIIALKKVSLWD